MIKSLDLSRHIFGHIADFSFEISDLDRARFVLRGVIVGGIESMAVANLAPAIRAHLCQI
jgi:hypothetical protein